ncbi:formylglycine-generating enzyme family protein [Mucilaginibacter myungsuensis]
MLLFVTQNALAQQSVKLTLKLGGNVDLLCTYIKPGKFMMGSPENDTLADKIERPQHEVAIDRAFYMGIYPITIKQFKVFVQETGYRTVAETDGIGGHGYSEANRKFEGLFPQYNWQHPGWEQSDEHPVVNISWIDANKFCEWASARTGKKISLPTEEEWEYACRAGTTTLFFTGDDPNSLKGYANISDDALRDKLQQEQKPDRTFPFNDGFPFTSPVGSFKPNPWGLYDMTGNVWQICDGTLPGSTPNQVAGHVAKGGSYNAYPEFARSAVRGRIKASSKYGYFGFRVVVK